ncbi:hypothetical protein WG904_00015 [Pedobacter sp. Du54]|uniref:hypothetical protein n=1 Tax=Pedobacter anseongensis TaxID=3133439 RepID=UPI0030A5AA6A
MLREISNKNLLYGSCLLTAFFGFLLLDTFVLHLTFVLIGVFRQLLTIPALVLLLFMLVLTSIRWVKAKFKINGYLFWSLSLLLIIATTLALVTVFE